MRNSKWRIRYGSFQCTFVSHYLIRVSPVFAIYLNAIAQQLCAFYVFKNIQDPNSYFKNFTQIPPLWTTLWFM